MCATKLWQMLEKGYGALVAEGHSAYGAYLIAAAAEAAAGDAAS